jgi:hypothetical protein
MTWHSAAHPSYRTTASRRPNRLTGRRHWVEPWQPIRRIRRLLAVIRTDVVGLLAHPTDAPCRVRVQVTGGLEPLNLGERNQPAKRRASRVPL